MDNPSRYAARPLAFLACYVRARPCSHAAIMMAVVGAVGCSVGAQYAVKVLVDTLAGGLYVGEQSNGRRPGEQLTIHSACGFMYSTQAPKPTSKRPSQRRRNCCQ